MDGVHDLGGREGFGSVPNKEDGKPFHAEWETRAFGIVQSSALGPGWSLDWFRHCRELIVPTDYLTRPYFDQWITTLAAQMVDEGYITLDEIRSGQSSSLTLPKRRALMSKRRRAMLGKLERLPGSLPAILSVVRRWVGLAIRGCPHMFETAEPSSTHIMAAICFQTHRRAARRRQNTFTQ
ncbi:hypothetical protein ACVITL_006009 [Rhizobium pisi]